MNFFENAVRWASTRLKELLLISAALTLSACNQQSDENTIAVSGDVANMSFTAPLQLLQSRNIDRDAIERWFCFQPGTNPFY